MFYNLSELENVAENYYNFCCNKIFLNVVLISVAISEYWRSKIFPVTAHSFLEFI